jgi:isopenicillin N synthase-like dioxygenase
MNEFRNAKAQQPLPPPLADNEARIDQFVSQCRDLCARIMELFAIGLQIDASAGGKHWFGPYHDSERGSSGSVFRLLYYPSLPGSSNYDQETDIRAGAHSDYGTVTLLFQRPGQPGLEILASRRGDLVEQWHSVPVNPSGETHTPILVNVGDLLDYWTNGLLKSAVHRVVFPKDGKGEDRYSMAYFCHPVDGARLEAVPSKVVEQATRKEKDGRNGDKKVMTAKEHLESRLAATYGSGLKAVK